MRSRQFPGAYRSCERFVGAIKVAAKNQAQSLVERRCRCHDILLGAPAYRVGGVGQHLFHPAAAHQRAKYGGMRFGVRGIRLRPVPILPAVDGISPPLSFGWSSHHRKEQRGQHGDHRVPVHAAVIVQPPEPALKGGEPALPVGGHSEPFYQGSCRADVPGGDGVLERFLKQAVVQAPAGRPAPQDRDQVRLVAFQLGLEHVTEQVVKAVPPALLVQRHQQQVRLSQAGQHRGGPGQVQHRLAQGPGHAL